MGCLLSDDARPAPFSGAFDLASLPFTVHLQSRQRPVSAQDLQGYDVILACGDNPAYLHLAKLCKSLGKQIVYVIENTPETRGQIAHLGGKSGLRLARAKAHILWNERRRRAAFRRADGVQANGYPAMAHYGGLNDNTLLYLDNRIENGLLASDAEMADQRDHLTHGGALRLIHSGRLEPLKGCLDLLPLARHLVALGVDFTLDIFGTGSLEAPLREGVTDGGLGDRVRIHGAVDFATGLVPFARRNGDIFVSVTPQSDPSCTYLESMGGGMAIAGYGNQMWAALARDSAAGWVVPVGDTQAMANALCAASRDRGAVADRCLTARDFCAAHAFETEFSRRMDQLRAL